MTNPKYFSSIHCIYFFVIRVDEGIGNTMSSTGFVTFTDLVTTTCTASTQLTHVTGLLNVNHAPEPRDIIWQNAHTDYNVSQRRQLITGILLALGAILWSIPLTLIQAFATSETLCRSLFYVCTFFILTNDLILFLVLLFI